MNLENILFKSKQLTSQMIGVYELSLSGFSSSDLTEMIGVAADLCSSLYDDIQNNIEAAEIKNTVLTELKNRTNNTAPQNSFAARLRLALTHSGMTQTTLAGLIGVSQGTVSAMVTGKSKEAGIARCGKIAQILGISADWLRYGEGEMTSFNFSR
ncbi:helix-turn-helix domain-containing protein [Providencia rettgeri]|nr:helix-turn-helix transcriptional regulator [Providencia rettgeri]